MDQPSTFTHNVMLINFLLHYLGFDLAPYVCVVKFKMSNNDVAVVDIDDESILSSIFKNKFSDEERRNPEFSLYLSRLSSFDIHKLNMEPARLENEKSRILDLTQDLAFQNYKTFIKTAKCSKDIFKDFGVIETRLQSLLDKLPLLSEHGHSFIKEAAGISDIRSSNSLTLTRHTELLEILEIPQLMDTCVRNQYYEDALELMFYVKRLDKKSFVAEIPLMTGVIKDVQQSSQLMLEQLLGQLRTAIQLPACLRVVGFLRRLECFTETELRLRFLQARNAWLESVLSTISVGDSDNDAYERITRTVEVYRVHLFDIVTQYRAIFSDDSDVLFHERINKKVDNLPYDASIFHCWLSYRIDLFLGLLQACLDNGVGNRLDSVLGQCMYFGQSFSRVGADFRCLLIPIFQKAVSTSFSKLIQETTKEFEREMMSYSLLSTSISYNQITPTGALSTATNNSEIPQPPISLLDYPPLAVYVNGILFAFNQLRICLPLSIATILPLELLASVKNVANIILAFYYAEEPAFSDSERMSFLRFCNAFLDEVIPHLEACARFLIPQHVITDVYGSSSVQSPHSNSIIDIDEVLAILQPCLPKEEVSEPAHPEPEEVLEDKVTAEEKPLHSNSADKIDDAESIEKAGESTA